jgi:ketosteroid isomerase-like protein
MSQENLENLRALLEAWNVEAWKRGEDMSLLDPRVTYEDTTLPDHVGETYRGHNGVARATARWIEPYVTFSIELDRIVGAGDRLVSMHRVRVTARYTGIEGEGPVAYVWTFRDGKVIHFRSYREPDEALEAVGLSEQDAHADS